MYRKQYEIVTDADKISVDIQKTCMERKTIKKWAYILHDKDDTRPHYHIYLNFGSSGVNSKDVAEWFDIPENFIEKVKGRNTDMLLYLTHGNDSQQNKHQYSPTEVVANFDFETEIENARILGDFKNFSYAQQLEYVNSLPVSEKATAFTKLEKLWRLHCQWLSLQTDRDIDVIFVCGKGGTGKTYYAKKLLASMGLDYCISSSKNDPFQDYLGQKAMILDDLRDSAFDFEDLLKILDNNTVSSVKSRFANKVFNGEIIVITSSVPLHYWYPEYKNRRTDDIYQLYRRISSYVVITQETVSVYTDIDENGRPKGFCEEFRNELQEKKKEAKPKRDFGRLFGAICEPVTFEPRENIKTIQTTMELPLQKSR